MKRLIKWLHFQYNCWRNPYFKALIDLDPKYVIPSTWDDVIQKRDTIPQ